MDQGCREAAGRSRSVGQVVSRAPFPNRTASVNRPSYYLDDPLEVFGSVGPGPHLFLVLSAEDSAVQYSLMDIDFLG
jgi:hypothetical protein